MLIKRKTAWVTAAVDEETAAQAIVLAKSLTRVVTSADTIVFISEDVPDHVGSLLTKYFDAIVLIKLDLKESVPTRQKMENLIMQAWNLPGYTKCVVLYSNKMVVKNCDELFATFEDFSIPFKMFKDEKQIDTSVMVIKPQFEEFRDFSSRISKFGKYGGVSDLIYDKCLLSKPGQLHEMYNFNVVQQSTSDIQMLDIKILSGLENTEPHTDEHTKRAKSGPVNFQGASTLWQQWKKETDDEIKISRMRSTKNLDDSVTEKHGHYKDAIAIVGHSCRFPGANNSDEFWELIKNGGDGIRSVPLERLRDYQLNDPKFTESKAGFLKCPIDEFDAKFFGISPREAAFMDPQQRLLAEVAWEALENAAINPHSLKGSNTGVFTGVWTHDYERLVAENSTAQDFHHVILGNSFSATSARVSYFLGLNGPNVATESGCSSSMVALHLACDSLRKRESNLGLVLGANIIILHLSLGEIPILAKDGHCKTFDESADGFGRAEGVAAVILKRLPDAIKNGDRIMGIIRGTAMSNEGTSSNFGTPSKLCQEIAIKDALNNAGVLPGEVDYVEAHGTGTPIGDPIEFSALSAGYTGERKSPLLIGSVKTNIGHTESVAGLAGLIKVMLAMEHEVIPPHRNFNKLNPNINLDTVPVVIPLESTPWCKNSDRVRIAGISSFGISGTNVHVVMEEPPLDDFTRPLEMNLVESEKSFHILTLSAKSENALQDLALSYYNYLEEHPKINIGDFTHTCNVGRAHFKYSSAVTGKTSLEFQKALEDATYNPPVLNEKPKIAFLFTGQGSQYFGMAKSLFQSNFEFRCAFNQCDTIIKDLVGISLKNALWSEDSNLLGQTVCSQLSIFSLEFGLLKMWESLGIVPDAVLGHSVGEFAAAVAAGIIDLEDALKLLAERSRQIQNLQLGGMLAIRSSKENVSQLISEFQNCNSDMWLDIAVINSKEEIVVAGNKNAIEAFKIFCGNNNTKFQVLAASHAFHSREMDKIAQSFGEFTQKVDYKSAKCQYISGTTGMILSDNEMEDGDYWVRHVRQAVEFEKAFKTLSDSGCNVFIEIGAHPVLLALGMSNLNCTGNKNLWLPSLRRNKDDWETLLDSVGTLYTNGFDIRWESLDKGYYRKKLDLPNYPFQRQKYWVDVSTDNHEKIIHPLLGKKIILADVMENVYENKWNLTDLNYIKDHQVAHVIVMPGAGFLEVILAAGKDILVKSTEDDAGVLTVKDFVVEAPLELEEGNKYKVQVVASPVENEPKMFYVKVFLFKKLNGYNNEMGWKRYSSGYVLLRDSISWPSKENSAPTLKGNSESNPDVNYETEKLYDIKLRCPIEKDSIEFYKLAPEIGIFFGKAFQSIEKVWTGENEAVALIPAPVNAGNLKNYVFHPIILDAMIQLFGLSIGNDTMDLYLPVGIDYAFMVNDSLSKCVYAHAKWTTEKSFGTVALYSDKNVLLAVMAGVRLVKTSISLFTNVINASKNMLPGMYQEVWRQRVGPLQSRVDVNRLEDTLNIMEPLANCMEEHMHMFNLRVQQGGHELVCLGIMINFLENGFCPQVGRTYIIEDFINDYLIPKGHTMQLKRYFEILCEDGYGVEIDNGSGFMDSWKCIKEFQIIEEMEIRVKQIDDYIFCEGASKGRTITATIAHKCFDNMWQVLIGKTTAVSALFGREDMNPLDVYTKSNECILASLRAGRYLGLALKEFKSDGKKEDSIVRIIEVGAGSGATSKEILAVLQKENIPFRYTFTDISPHFFEGAKEKFSAISGIEYKVLDIEKDPSTQGFSPNHYDVVVAANVIHATENLKNSMTNIRKLICTDGILVLQEITHSSRPIDLIFGILEGYWKFTDYDVRSRHPMVSPQVWSKVLVATGFTKAINVSSKDEFITVLVSRATNSYILENNIISSRQDNNNRKSAWVIFSQTSNLLSEQLKSNFAPVCDIVVFIQKRTKKTDCNNETIYFYDESVTTDDIGNILQQYSVKGIIFLATEINYDHKDTVFKPILSTFQYLSEKALQNLQFIIVTRGTYYIQNQKAVSPFGAVLWGMAKAMCSENPKMLGKMIDLDPDVSDAEVESKEIFFEAFDQEDILICFRNKKRFVSKMVNFPKQLAPLTLPEGRYRIDVPKSKKINDVTFSSIDKDSLGPKQVEILVKAVALNFRDIFVILKPVMYTTLKDTIGSDVAGIVSKVGSDVTKFAIGDEVYGVTISSGVGSHAVTHEGYLFLKPKELTFSDASTFPSVILTAYYCMVNVADLKNGETILIHVASGGVGLIAIQIAKIIGANIIATAGSYRKRNYLRSLGIKHVFHSRDLTYGDEIARVTDGRGVDMVLNSLTGLGFKETSLKACAPNARFVEIGKVNIWMPDEVLNLRPDVQYTIVDLEKLLENLLGDLVQQLRMFKETFKPLPYARFDAVNIRDALNYFLKAQHIGKVVVTMPNVVEVGNQLLKEDAFFSKNATYLITGGLGGIGLEVAKWMTDSGCKNLVLIGRSEPSENAAKTLNGLRAKGCRICTFPVDVGNWDQCLSLFQTISSPESRLPPLRGVIHSAGVISDAIYMNQSWEKYQTVFNAKISGCINLHRLTKDLNLEHFVLFSSIAGLLGPMGQSNHGAANAFLDSFAHYRHSIGLPAQTINWGGWAEVGAASNTAFGKEGAFGVKPFTPNQGIATLKFIMSRPDLLQVGVVQVEMDEFKQYFSLGNALSELVDEVTTADTVLSSIQSEKFWAEIEPLSLEDRNIYFKIKITAIIRKTLKLPESEAIDEFQTFQEMGLDSLMAVEMKNKLQNIVGKKITLNVASMMDYPTVSSLAKHLSEQTMNVEIEGSNGSEKISTEIEFDTEAMYALVKQDSVLDDGIRGQGISKKPSEVTNILLTGSTGHLGVYLLKELTHRKNINVSCLIRGKSMEQARRRLASNLKKNGLLESVNFERISIVMGDITEEFLGIPQEEYNKLSRTTEMVIHLAAKANHVEKYQISKVTKMDVRSVNVLGTVNILKFATNITTKRVFFPSSFSTINRFTEDGFISEEFPDDDNNGDDITLGYSLSKLVCEKLLRQANERGIPCTVIRYSSLMGHSETGQFMADNNSVINNILLFLRFKMVPDVEGSVFCLPVDTACKLTVKILFNDEVLSRIFNLVQPVPMYMGDIIKVAKQSGYMLNLVNIKEYEKMVNHETENNSFLTIFKDSYGEDLSYTALSKTHPKLRQFLEKGINTNRVSDRCRHLIPDIVDMIPHPQSILHSYFKFAEGYGIFERFGIVR